MKRAEAIVLAFVLAWVFVLVLHYAGVFEFGEEVSGVYELQRNMGQ